MEAYLHGVSTRKVDDLVKALGAETGISKSEVSRICEDLELKAEARRQFYTEAAEGYEKLAAESTGEERDRLLQQAQKNRYFMSLDEDIKRLDSRD
jgi:hypothetical protein